MSGDGQPDVTVLPIADLLLLLADRADWRAYALTLERVGRFQRD